MEDTAFKRMCDIADKVNQLSDKDKNLFYRYLFDTGILTESEVDEFKKLIALHKLFMDADYYYAVKNAVMNMISEELFRKE